MVFHFHGCYYHGYPRCYEKVFLETNRAHLDHTYREVYEATRETTAALGAQGKTVIECWECHCDRMVKKREDLQAFLFDLEFVEPLNPLEAFFKD